MHRRNTSGENSIEIKSISRRQFISVAGLAVLGIAGACASPQMPDAPVCSQRPRSLRIAHLTDFHVYPSGGAPEGMRRALRHAQGQADPPDIILNTGDSIMDSLEADKSQAEAQWEVFNQIIAEECKLPIYHVIGNHDVWGWAGWDPQIQNDPLYGKAMAMNKLGLAERYYSFDRAGWHFIILDSTHLPNEASEYPYIGQLDEEQYTWMEEDINTASSEVPICIVSHIPILCACEFLDGPNEESGNWTVPAAWMHIDARRMRQLFLKHANVRLCLSGHAHQHESLDYLGIRYMTNGAVCGNFWNGPYMDFPPAYVLVDLYEDGSVESTFVAYDQE